MKLLAASSYREITPDQWLPLCGQLHQRIPTHTRDPLTTNALVLQDGDREIAIVSIDIIAIPEEIRLAVLERLSASGFRGPVWLAATHTHLAPFVRPVFWDEQEHIDTAWVASVAEQTVEAIEEARENLEPMILFCGEAQLQELAYQRMGITPEGHTQMYHGANAPDFLRMAGPRDPGAPLLWGRRESDDSVAFVLSSFPCHPNCMESETFYSADLPGETRRFLRTILGENLGVIYLTGCAGDTAPKRMVGENLDLQPWKNDPGAIRAGQYLGSSLLAKICEVYLPMRSHALDWRSSELPKIKREPSQPIPESGIRKGHQKLYSAFHEKSHLWPEVLNSYQNRVNSLRVGDFALCTNTAELYVEFGLYIREHSPATVTAISELTDGYMGYVPTPEVARTGGYSGWHTFNSFFAERTGDDITRASLAQLHELFPNT